MGCGSSTPQPLPQPHQEAEAASSGGDSSSSSSSSSKKLRLSRLIRRRGVDSIRGRRNKKRVVEDTVTTVDHPSPDHKMSSNRGNHVVVVEPVWRGIEEEEREYGSVSNNNNVSSKTKDGVRKMYVPDHSPSFNVYCARVDSFDTNSSSSSTKDTTDSYDDVKTMHGSMDTAPSVMSSDEEEEEEEESRKSKVKVQKGGEITKKTAWNWRLASPLGMKNLLFVMSSCYSSSPHNRHTLLSRG